VVQTGPAVGGRWPLVEDPGLTVLAEAANRAHDVALGPSGQHTLFESDQVEIGVDGTEGHGS
jgi:hypothetical protein